MTVDAQSAMEHPTGTSRFEDEAYITEGGERVSHLNQNIHFQAHLSIYNFAERFCEDGVVLDAGCGSGYGAARLAEAGARHVDAIDISAKAIEFSRHHFGRPHLEFAVASIESLPFPHDRFDLVYTSNTLEHVADVRAFLREAHRVLKPSGTLLVAVPPIAGDAGLYINLINRYHLNIWSPRQWQFVIGQFFENVNSCLHGAGEIGTSPEAFASEHGSVTAADFVVARGSVDEMYRTYTMTSIFLASRPRPEASLPSASAPIVFVNDSFTRREGDIPKKLKRRLRPYFTQGRRRPIALLKGAWRVWRKHGIRRVLHDTVETLRNLP